jgi:hypothetical protein
MSICSLEEVFFYRQPRDLDCKAAWQTVNFYGHAAQGRKLETAELNDARTDKAATAQV